jgi:hypothetical protein
VRSEKSPPANLTVEMRHHYMGDETPIVNVAKCVAFITANSKRNDSEYHPFIQQFIGELSLIVDGDGTIDPLDK